MHNVPEGPQDHARIEELLQDVARVVRESRRTAAKGRQLARQSRDRNRRLWNLNTNLELRRCLQAQLVTLEDLRHTLYYVGIPDHGGDGRPRVHTDSQGKEGVFSLV